MLIVLVFGLRPIDAAAAVDSLPPIKIMRTSGSMYTERNLPKGKPFMLVYFAPDCEHCQKLMNQLFPKLNEFRKVEILLVTFKPLQDLKEFEKQYNTKKYTNMVTGTEGTGFYLRYHYNIQKTPFIAIYDRKGSLAGVYRNTPTVQELADKVKSLK